MEDSNQKENAGRGSTKMCSVLFVDIVGYSKKTNTEQIALKHQFVTLWAKAIEGVPAADIMVVDAGDGAALTALVEPEDTIKVAVALRNAVEEDAKKNPKLPVRMGINFGPVQMSTDVHGKACIVGDAINIAQRIMSFADSGQVTVSRSYYDIIKPLAHKYEEMFYYLGQRSDKHVRHHHIYGLGKPGQAAPVGDVAMQSYGSPEDEGHSEEIKQYAPQPQAPQSAPPQHSAEPQKPANKPPLNEPFSRKIVRGLVSMLKSILDLFLAGIRWVAFIIPILIIAYELLVLVPLINKPGAVKVELNSQMQMVTHFVKSKLGMTEAEAEAAVAAPEAMPAKRHNGTHRAQSGVSPGN